MNAHLIAAGGTVALALWGSHAACAAPGLPPHSAPAGFRAVDGAHGGRFLGGALRGPFATPSAALRATLLRLRTYFTGPLPVTAALQSKTGIVALFRGHLGATPVVGLTIIEPTASGGATVGALFDTPERAGASLRSFRSAGASSAAGSAASAPARIALTRTRLPDGSGSIGVPAGWRIASANRGMVDLTGADGAQAHIGVSFPVWDPRAGLADPSRLQVPFTADPVAALLAITDRVWSIRHQRAPSTEILDTVTVQPPLGSGRAALVHGRVHAADPLEFLTLANSAPLSASTWMFYATTLSAPPAHFAADFPVMLAIWQSYQADPGYLRSVQADTASTLRAAAQIVDAGTEHSIVAASQSNAGLDNIINGNEILARSADGTHWLGNADTARALAAAHPDQYRILPIDEYRSGDY